MSSQMDDLTLEVECLEERRPNLKAAIATAERRVAAEEAAVSQALHDDACERRDAELSLLCEIQEHYGERLKRFAAACYIANVKHPNPTKPRNFQTPTDRYGPVAELGLTLKTFDWAAALRPTWAPRLPGSAHAHEPIVGVDSVVVQMLADIDQ